MGTVDAELLSRAYAACASVARTHYENFPVASRLLPPPMRPHVAAVYAFARIADDLADEGHETDALRRLRLATWRARLHDTVDRPAAAAQESQQDLVIVAIAETVRRLNLPLSLFDDLISAFVQDTNTTRYDSWTSLFDYCRRSANPVGRLVLRIGGYRDPALDRSSDALCTALQLTNFWQDLGRDWTAGRLYVPREVQVSCRASEGDLNSGTPGEAWQAALQRCIDVTKASFLEGRHVCDGVKGRLRFELRVTWHGGRRILEKVERRGAHVLSRRPTLERGDIALTVWRAIRWQGTNA